MKNKILSLVFLLLLIGLLPKSCLAQDQQESILSFDSNVNIQEDAKSVFTETIVYNFGTLSKHGIFREIPTSLVNNQNQKFEVDIKTISVTNQEGIPYRYSSSYSNGNLSIKIGDPNNYITGINTYKITYEILGAIRYFSDHDEFYWNITGNGWQIPISKITTTVLLPGSTAITKTICYTGVYGSSSQNCQNTFSKNEAIFSGENLNPKENLSVAVSFPKGSVAVVEPKKATTGNGNPLLLFLMTSLISLILIFYYWILPLLVIARWYARGRDPKTNPNIPVWFDAPKNSLGERLTPSEVGSLVDETVDNREITATIVDLAVRGYLKIQDEQGDKYSFTKTKEFSDDPKLKDYEKEILKGVFKLGAKSTTKSIEGNFYRTFQKVKELLYQDLVLGGFFQESPEAVRARYYILGIMSLFTLNIFLTIVCFVCGKNMPRKTTLGSVTNIVALGLKKFLSSQERQLEFQTKNWYFFEKLLPYAIVFGVEDIWADRFKDLNSTPPDWYQGSNLQAFNTLTFVNSLNNTVSRFEESYSPPTSTTSSRGFSSGFSSGGGFSGGGGGGGGGGSW